MGLFGRSIDDSDWVEQIKNHYNYILIQDLPAEYEVTLKIELKYGPEIEDEIFRKVSGCAWVVSSCKEAENQLKRIPNPKSDLAQQVRSDLLKSFKALVWSAQDGIKWANRAVNEGMHGLTDNRGQTYHNRHLEWGLEGINKLDSAVNFIGKVDLQQE